MLYEGAELAPAALPGPYQIRLRLSAAEQQGNREDACAYHNHQPISTPQKPNMGKNRSISAGTVAGALP